MNESLLAGRYAKALLNQALEEGVAGELYPILRHLSRSIPTAAGWRATVDNPTLSEELRARFVVALAGGTPPELLVRFVELIFAHNREALLGEMARAYVRLYRRHQGITYARITTSRELTPATIEQLRGVLTERFGGQVELEIIVDAGLIGGFVVRVDGRQMDASIKGQLERIRRQFAGKNKTIV
jgi:F-type H+-transporting ATPase subunit delta